MRENGIRSFVTRDGQVIRAPAEEVETQSRASGRQQPSMAEVGARPSALSAAQDTAQAGGQDQHRPPRNRDFQPASADGRATRRAAMGGGINIPRLASFMLLGLVCVFVITLTIAGIYGAGKLIFSEKDDRTAEVSVESNRIEMRKVDSQKPKVARNEAISSHTFSYPDVRSGVNEEDYDNGQQVQPRKAMQTDGQQRWEQEIPSISTKPAVDYWESINKMKSAISAQASEIKRAKAVLSELERGDEND